MLRHGRKAPQKHNALDLLAIPARSQPIQLFQSLSADYWNFSPPRTVVNRGLLWVLETSYRLIQFDLITLGVVSCDICRFFGDAQPVIALMISFIVAGVFWLSHHRRLTFALEGGRGEVFLNLIFLLSIVMLPVTNGLYGLYRLDSVVAVTYGLHLTVIASLNALLWILALRGHRNPELLATAIFPVFALGAIHMVLGIWRASGGLVGSPALAGQNALPSLISANGVGM